MKILATFLTLMITIHLSQGQPYGEKPQRVVITGKVLNHESHPEIGAVGVYVDDVGRATQLAFSGELYEKGYFKVEFERYLPQDVFLKYQTILQVLIHPGDSIHVTFDGSYTDPDELLKHVAFSGDAAEQNHHLTMYIQDHFAHHYGFHKNQENQKKMEPEVYKAWWDSIADQMRQRQRSFVERIKPSKEVELWTYYFVEIERIRNLLQYPIYHRMSNKLGRGGSLDDAYYDFLDDMPEITVASLINTAGVATLINRYHFGYIMEKIMKKYDLQASINPDSLVIQGIIHYSQHGNLLRAMVLCEFFNQHLRKQEKETYENYKELIDQYIQEPFLIEPLEAHYQEVKSFYDNPQVSSQSVLENLSDMDNQVLLDSILQKSKNKVVYVDIWATWCGPCIREFPKSKELHEQLKEKDISFVYLCTDSEEEKWKSMLAKFQLPGQHYLLSKEQSAFLRSDFNFSGIPHYILIDQNGTIVGSGSHLRPSGDTIKEILDEPL